MREESTNIIRKIPLLGDIPLLGELFKSRDVTKRNTELLVFITPIVVNNTSDNVPMNAPFIERLESIRDDVHDQMGKEKKHKEGKSEEPVLVPIEGGTETPAPVEPTKPE